MAKKILKFGGTSVGTIERIQHVAKIIQKEHTSGNKIIAVVSAMSGRTNELIKQSKDISLDFDKREFDVLVSSGEQVTSALLAGALIKLKIKAKSWLNWQIPILTDGEHSNARIVNMSMQEINKYSPKNFFWHQNDICTLTSSGKIWLFPKKYINSSKAVFVLPELSKNKMEFNKYKCFGICTDYVNFYYNNLN